VREIVGVPGRVEGDVVEIADLFLRRGGVLPRTDGSPPFLDRFENAGYDVAASLAGATEDDRGAGSRPALHESQPVHQAKPAHQARASAFCLPRQPPTARSTTLGVVRGRSASGEMVTSGPCASEAVATTAARTCPVRAVTHTDTAPASGRTATLSAGTWTDADFAVPARETVVTVTRAGTPTAASYKEAVGGAAPLAPSAMPARSRIGTEAADQANSVSRLGCVRESWRSTTAPTTTGTVDRT